MAATLSASEAGLKIFEKARKLKGWNKTASGKNSPWPLDINKSTLERFHKQQPIKYENFVAICGAVGIEWENIVDLSESTEPTEIVDSNLPIALAASTDLDTFSPHSALQFSRQKLTIEIIFSTAISSLIIIK